jgi:hypothetical protein
MKALLLFEEGFVLLGIPFYRTRDLATGSAAAAAM